MENVILVIHLFLALAIIGLILLQRSEGGGLGIGGGGGLGGTTAKGTTDILTKATAWCAAAFFCTSLVLGVLAGQGSTARQGILEELSEAPAAVEESVAETESLGVPVEAPAAVPAVPISE